MGVPAEHLNFFKKKQICRWIWIPCPLLWRETFVVWIFPCNTPPYSVVYDPTAFMACKLVVVAWLIAYGAATTPRAPCGTTATWWRCSARVGIEVVDQVPLPSYTAVPFCYKIFSLEMFRCSNRNSTTGWCRGVPSSNQEEMVWREKVWHDLGLQKRRMWSRKESKRRVVTEG